MKRFGILVVGLILGASIAGLALATGPPANLKLVGDHWTAWDPPEAGPDAYLIQKGDTLWDLAEQWFGDPFLWPQVWDENRYILDSHWIYPGDPLVVPGRPTVVPEGGPPVAVLPPARETDIPDTPAPTPVLPGPDPVLPVPDPLLPVATVSEIQCSGFISPGNPTSGLSIVGHRTERYSLAEGNVVFLNQGSNHGLRAGDSFVVRRWTEPVIHPSTDESIGILVRRLGRVRILLTHENTSTALIEMSCEDIYSGDELVPWKEIPTPMMTGLPPFDPLDPTPTGGLAGQIVSSRDNLWALGQGHLIYTDLGQHTGVSPGDVLLVYRERDHGLPRNVLGQAVILTVEAETSTAKMMSSTRESVVGDWVEVWR